MNKVIRCLRSLKNNIYIGAKRKSDDIAYSGDYGEEITIKANSKNYYSSTNYFIFVDLKNFRTNIFIRKNNKWVLEKTYLCTIGKPSTPTITGDFKVGAKGLYFGVERGYKCYYYTQIKGNYLFHSIIYNLDDTVRDGRLGMKLSDGCIRLAKENAKWLWDNVGFGSAIHIE
ncbi:ErfK/YbiS/YcfS/YnhG family protein [Clostridium bornimense]|uniref:ErfK/YbiS/YcfS/YnhG family protein n=1 Tax=Clostridium bornimense TaxID=1216932 RepID=W6RT77_9CLOT|nr:L,D-transpeptidase [Clostridium bornimense]CDM67458.1 ErfK/YbiS/YcfS/YnhG family protein [Clostridium bornimense]